ncbi:hypothetical protein EDD18DRAFT_1203810 [Armillaria luteobubalina]|uniref:F-box domain-containing protein n=1 Tax=Armillaria luteobubalina TaxID=153913 RepID=A0AA39PBE9_9AGAR|nr:hypothetical protein EDD18DRAFT_1203810 [Armillaria luteobubalina]
MKPESPKLSKDLKGLSVFLRGAENDSISYKYTLGTDGSLSEKDISDLRTSNFSLNDDLALLDWFSSVVIPHRREKLRASIAFQTALLTTLPPTNPEEHHFFYTAPYNDSAVSSLPSEILVEIFGWLGDLGSEYDDLDVEHGTNWVITHVCRTWRSIAVSTPSLWASISIEDDLLVDNPFTDGKSKLLQEYLSRSGQNPLRVTLSSSYDIEKHMEIISPHLPRCTDLDLTVTAEAINPHFTIEGEFPNLKRLSLVVEGCISDRNEQPFISGEAPHLLDVLVQGIDITYVELPLTNLKSFTGDICRYQVYMQLFATASQLETAKMDARFPVLPFDVLPEPFIHTKLRTLSLSPFIEALQGLRLPALETFLIEYIYPGGHCSIAELLRESGCPLRCLYLETAALPWSELRPIIEACSSTLESLSIRVNEESAPQVHDALSFNRASHHLDTSAFAPHLTELCIRDDSYSLDADFAASFHQLSFVSMVWWRQFSRKVAQLKSLTMCAPYSPRPEKALMELEELKEEGLKVEFYGYVWTKMI